MRKVILLLLSSAGVLCHAYAQSVADIATQMAAQQDGQSQIEELTAYYQDLADHPVNINLATHDDLAQLGFLSAFQVLSFLDYRASHGPLFSWNELSLITGFTQEDVAVLSRFFTLDSNTQSSSLKIPDIWKWTQHQVLTGVRTTYPRDSHYSPITEEEYRQHPNSRYLGVPWTRYLKYTGTYSKHLQWGVTLQSDAGERQLADYASFNLQLKDHRNIQTIVLGDYQARFGQGLVVWKGFTFASGASGEGWRWQEMGLRASSSTQESASFRGVGTTLALGRWKASAFVSYRKVDARLGTEGFTSLPADGYHRTPSELDRKHTLGAWAVGGNATFGGEWYKLGLTAITYGYSREDARQVRYYNKEMNRSNPFGAIGLNADARLYSWRLFAESALDFASKSSALAGVQHYSGGGWENTLVMRFFGVGYTSAYGASLGRNTTSSNEYSLQWTTLLPFTGGGNLSGMTYLALFPKPRYLCNRPSYGWQFRLQWNQPQGHVMVRQQRSLSTIDVEDVFRLRVHRNVPLGNGFIVGARVEGVCCLYYQQPRQMGGMAFVEGKYVTINKRFTASFRLTAYHTTSWESRLYAYENDVLYGFAVPALYEKGLRAYAVFKYSAFRWADIWVKVGNTFIGNARTEVKVQLRLLFGSSAKTFSDNGIQ